MSAAKSRAVKKNNTRKRKLVFPVKIIFVLFISLASLAFVVFSVARYFRNCDYFTVQDSKYFTGENLFKIDLKKESQRLARIHRGYKNIILRRLLPNKIVVDFVSYRPVALLRLSDYFYVDGEGVLFDAMPAGSELGNLPLIVGLDKRVIHPRSGVKYNEKSLEDVLRFIKSLNSHNKLSQSLKVKEINLANINDVFLFTTDGCKINLGDMQSLDKDVLILNKLIAKTSFDLAKIVYIDLRFKEPAVKYK